MQEGEETFSAFSGYFCVAILLNSQTTNMDLNVNRKNAPDEEFLF
jgi:hypothetical protein